MSYQHYKKQLPFAGEWQDDYVLSEVRKEHIAAIENICKQCKDRPIYADELDPHFTALSESNETIRLLGKRILTCLKNTNQDLRKHDVEWCVERIKLQFRLQHKPWI